MRILLIGTTSSGLLLFRLSLLLELVNKGHDVHVLASDFSANDELFLNSKRINIHRYNLIRSGLNPLKDLKVVLDLHRVISRVKPDIVFSYFVKPVIYGTIAAKFASVRHRIVMLEGLGFPFTRQPGKQRIKTLIIKNIQITLYRLALPFASKVIFLNNDDLNELLISNGIKCKESYVLGPIGLDLSKFKYIRPNISALKFLFIGRLLKEKGVYEFLQAAKEVKSVYPNVEFIVLGGYDNTSPNSLTEEELFYYINNSVITYKGVTNNVYDTLVESSVFILPSYREGFPRSTQEAMAVGRPIITTDVPGCRDTVVNGLNGFIVPPFKVNAIVERCIWFINNPEKVIEMGRASHQIATEKFDVHKVNQRLFKIMDIEDL